MLFPYLGGFLKHLGDRQICDSKFTFGVNVGVNGCLSYWKHCHKLPEITDQIHPSIFHLYSPWLPGQQSEQGLSDFPLPGYCLQLLQEDSTAFFPRGAFTLWRKQLLVSGMFFCFNRDRKVVTVGEGRDV